MGITLPRKTEKTLKNETTNYDRCNGVFSDGTFFVHRRGK